MKTISCLIEFNVVSKTAVQHAIWLAKQNNTSIELLYFDSKERNKEELKKRVLELTNIESSGVDFTCTVFTGNAIDFIAETVNGLSSQYFVIGTFGTQSKSDLWTAKNIVSLTQQVKIPTLTVNEFTTELSTVQKILFPIAPHTNFDIQSKEAGVWALKNNAEINVFCLVAGDKDMPDDISKNIKESEAHFSEIGVPYYSTVTETEVYSVGYAKDIVKYTESNAFDLITIMALNSEENMYFGDFEKIILLQNPLGIPVLCVND